MCVSKSNSTFLLEAKEFIGVLWLNLKLCIELEHVLYFM